MLLVHLLDFFVSAAPIDALTSPATLGTSYAAIQSRFAACSGNDARPQLSTTCRLRAIGHKIDVTFHFNPLQQVESYSFNFAATMRQEDAATVYNELCQRLRHAFPQFSEHTTPYGVRRQFVLPYHALALADFAPGNGPGQQVSVVVKTVDVRPSADAAMQLQLPPLQLDATTPDLSERASSLP